MQASTPVIMTPHPRPLKLPKLSLPKLFRIRSASKQKQNQAQIQTRTNNRINSNQQAVNDLASLNKNHKKSKIQGITDTEYVKCGSLGKSSLKGRCNSLQTKNSVKNIKNQGYKLSDGTTNSSQQQQQDDNLSTQSCKKNNKNNLKRSCGINININMNNKINNKNTCDRIQKKQRVQRVQKQRVSMQKLQKFNKSISNTQNSIIQMQKQHERNLQNLCNIARMFDPTLMIRLSNGSNNNGNNNNQTQAMGNTKDNNNMIVNLNKQKQHRKINLKILNQHIFQPNIKKHEKHKHQNGNKYKNNNNDFENNQQYWNKVNESLILASCKTVEIDNQVSKDLREIYQTLVTE